MSKNNTIVVDSHLLSISHYIIILNIININCSYIIYLILNKLKCPNYFLFGKFDRAEDLNSRISSIVIN